VKHLLAGQRKLSFAGGERVLLARTDALGDLMVSLPVQRRLLSRHPSLQIHWLVRPYAAPLLKGHPDVAGVHLREPGQDLAGLLSALRPHAVLNLGHRDKEVTVAAQRAAVPVRVARARGLSQILAATDLLWRGRYGTGRHEAMNVLDFLSPWRLDGGAPEAPRLFLAEAERAQGERDLQAYPRPRLGVFLRGSGAGAFPNQGWWDSALTILAQAGWTPVLLGPPEGSALPPTDLRGLLGRMAACDVILGPSSGPAHFAPALGLPSLCLMGLRPNHTPDRWGPLGAAVQVLQYPGPEADLAGGMDRLDPQALLPHLQRALGLRPGA